MHKLELLAFLLNQHLHGVSLELMDGSTVLHVAAALHDDLEAFKQLLRSGIPSDVVNDDGHTVLDLAVDGTVAAAIAQVVAQQLVGVVVPVSAPVHSLGLFSAAPAA